jgi:hypothetical protein
MTKATAAAVCLGAWGLLGATCSEPAFPCADTEPRCDPGYICIKDPSPLGQVYAGREVCVRKGATALGNPCSVSEECKGFSERTTVCADMDRRCPTGAEAACDLRCRPVCIGHYDCGPDQICYPGGGDIPGVCQEGECGQSHPECPTGLECWWVKAGPSGGLCYAPCDILRWIDCDRQPPPPDAQCCAPQEACVHFASNPAAATCLPVGRANRGETCDTEEAQGLPSCKEGMFCSDLLGCANPPADGNCTGFCLEYCNRLGGQPACNQAGVPCNSFVGGSQLAWGYCGQ